MGTPFLEVICTPGVEFYMDISFFGRQIYSSINRIVTLGGMINSSQVYAVHPNQIHLFMSLQNKVELHDPRSVLWSSLRMCCEVFVRQATRRTPTSCL